MRLGDKLILVSSAIVIAVLGCGGFLALRAYEDFEVRLAKTQALQDADVIAKSMRYHMLKNRRDDVQWIVEMVGQQEGIADVRVFNGKGVVSYAARRSDIGRREDKTSEVCAYCHRPGATLWPETTGLDAARLVTTRAGSRQIAVMSPIRNEAACRGCHPAGQKVLGNLEVILSIDALTRQIEANRRRSLVLLVALVFLISAALGFLTLREITLPVGRLHAGFDRVGAGDLSVRVAVSGSGEMAQLSEAFNRMTGQLQATRELEERNLRLEAASRLKSDFVRDVSRELQAPLATIESCLHAVLEGFAGDEAARSEQLARARRKAGTLTQLVRDLLDLARLGESRASQTREPVDLAAAVEKASAALAGKAARRGVRVSLAPSAGVPPVEADPRDVGLLVSNLLDNAVKYNRQDGEVRVSLEAREGRVVLSVADDGIGMSPEELAHLYTEFYRSPAARKLEKDGTGLGLSIVKRLVERQGGAISVSSAPGVGTRFELSFPAASA